MDKMTDNASELHKMANEGSQKFDYFLCSVTAALVAYLTQTTAPQKMDTFFSVLQFVALIFLCASFFCGIRRIKYGHLLMRHNADSLYANSNAVEIHRTLNSPKPIFTDQSTGLDETRIQVEKRRVDFILARKKADELANKANVTLGKFGTWQLIFLAAGFGIILLARILQPYESGYHLTYKANEPLRVEVVQSVSTPLIQTNK